MSMMAISCIALGLLLKSVGSELMSNKLCVHESPINGINGEYEYGGFDSTNENEYWTKPVGSWCTVSAGLDEPLNEGDPLYIRYSMWWYIWQISYGLHDWDYFAYKCDSYTRYPSDCGNHNQTHWYSWYDEQIMNLNITNGECLPSHNETYLTITGYDGFQGCNGEFSIVDGKTNLYKRIEDYDYGWTNEWGQPTGPEPHYWLYNNIEQGWFCDLSPSMDDYANSCEYEHQYKMDDSEINFHD